MLTFAERPLREPVIRATVLAFIWLTAVALLMASPALAQDPPGNNGTIKVHDNNPGEPDPVVKNQPHVCEFDLHFFFADANQSGDWWIRSWPPNPGERDVVLSSDTEGPYMTDANGEDRKPDPVDEYYSLDDGHYKLFWEGAMNPGGQQNIKHKVFWVDCPEDVSGGGNGGGGNVGGGGGGPTGGQPGGEVLGGAGGPGGQPLPDTGMAANGGALVAALIALAAWLTASVAAVRTRRARAIR
jgi:hypothetical protein